METLVPESPRAVVDCVAEEELAPGATETEETRVTVPAEARDDGVVAATTPQAAPDSVVPVVQLPDSSEEYGDSREIGPAVAASAAIRIAEFASASEEVLNAGASEGPHHGVIIPSGVPPEFLRDEQEEEDVWQAQIEAGSQILNHLNHALEPHRTTYFHICQVGGSLLELLVFDFDFSVSYPHLSAYNG